MGTTLSLWPWETYCDLLTADSRRLRVRLSSGAALVTGAVLVYLNRLQPYQVTQDEAKSTAASVTPFLGAGGGGASAAFRF